MLRLAVEAHVINAHFLLPLVIRNPGGLVVELTDGTEEINASYRTGTTLGYYLAKAIAHPLAKAEAAETAAYDCTAVAVTPGWLRSEAMLEEAFGVTEDTWREGIAQSPHFAISETPTFVARGVAALAGDPERKHFSGQTLTSFQMAQRYDLTDIDVREAPLGESQRHPESDESLLGSVVQVVLEPPTLGVTDLNQAEAAGLHLAQRPGELGTESPGRQSGRRSAHHPG
jgi:hypothetical protein